MELFDVYSLYPVEPVRGCGSYVYDAAGTEYLDLYGGHAVISIGHAHPHYVKRISEQAARLGFYSNSVENSLQRELAAKLGGVLKVFSNERANAVLRFELSDNCVSRNGEVPLMRTPVRDYPQRETETTNPNPPGEGERIRVLHGTEVSDAPQLLGRLLGAQNIEVHSFSDANRLFEEVRRTRYDVCK